MLDGALGEVGEDGCRVLDGANTVQREFALPDGDEVCGDGEGAGVCRVTTYRDGGGLSTIVPSGGFPCPVQIVSAFFGYLMIEQVSSEFVGLVHSIDGGFFFGNIGAGFLRALCWLFGGSRITTFG